MSGMLNFKSAAVAAGLALAALASPASATTELKLTYASMDTTYRSYINGQEVLSNGITFTAKDVISPGVFGAPYSLFAFCVDIFHHISTGPLSLTYISNKGDPGEPLTTNFNPNPMLATLSTAQKNRVSALVDIGFLLNRDSPGAATSLQTAAIQSAIWKTLNPTATITLKTAGLSGATAMAYTTAYNHYLNDPVAAGDRIFTIVPKSPGDTQRFAVGWPIDVPEPGTWALMLVGFMGAGSALRTRRSREALARL